jgi:hypothetical protein
LIRKVGNIARRCERKHSIKDDSKDDAGKSWEYYAACTSKKNTEEKTREKGGLEKSEILLVMTIVARLFRIFPAKEARKIEKNLHLQP